MDITPEALAEVEKMARLQFSRAEIAVILDVPESTLTGTGNLAVAMLRGQLKAEGEVRQSILDLATSGNAPAQKQFLELVQGRIRKDALEKRK